VTIDLPAPTSSAESRQTARDALRRLASSMTCARGPDPLSLIVLAALYPQPFAYPIQCQANKTSGAAHFSRLLL
jgi:hypothetical protein